MGKATIGLLALLASGCFGLKEISYATPTPFGGECTSYLVSGNIPVIQVSQLFTLCVIHGKLYEPIMVPMSGGGVGSIAGPIGDTASRMVVIPVL